MREKKMAEEVAYPGQMLELTFGGSGGLPPERLHERLLTQWFNAESQPIDRVSLPPRKGKQANFSKRRAKLKI